MGFEIEIEMDPNTLLTISFKEREDGTLVIKEVYTYTHHCDTLGATNILQLEEISHFFALLRAIAKRIFAEDSVSTKEHETQLTIAFGLPERSEKIVKAVSSVLTAIVSMEEFSHGDEKIFFDKMDSDERGSFSEKVKEILEGVKVLSTERK